MDADAATIEPRSAGALQDLFESFERLVDAVETVLDDDSREGAALTGDAWTEARDRLLARARESKRAMDRADVIAALG